MLQSVRLVGRLTIGVVALLTAGLLPFAPGYPQTAPGYAQTEGIGQGSGTYTWAQLGLASPLMIAQPTTPAESQTAGFSFPIAPSAHEGGATWWYLHVAGTVQIDRDTSSQGSATLWIDVNGNASALLHFTVTPGESDVRWESANFEGSTAHVASGPLIPFTFDNVLPVPAITGGDATVVAMLDLVGRPGAVSATISPSSSFEITDRPPNKLDLKIASTIYEDGTLAIPFQVVSTSDTPSANVQAAARIESGSIELLSPIEPLNLGDVYPSASFVVRVKPPPHGEVGRLSIRITGAAQNDTAHATFEIRDRETTHRGVSVVFVLFGSAIALCGLGFVAAAKRQAG